MNETMQTQTTIPSTVQVAAGEDRFGEQRGLGISTITFKVSPQDSGGLFILENTFREKGGPARHLHYHQDEWFYAVEGEFIVEVGPERIRLNPGDSLLAPRQVPHVWAYVGDSRGQDTDCVYARWPNGSVLSRSDQGQCHATAGSGIVARSRHGVAGSTLGGRVKMSVGMYFTTRRW